MKKVLLKLYVAGQTMKAQRAITNLCKISEDDLGGECEIIVIDVLEHPELAEKEKILATPTLIKEVPPPLRRIIGDLSDTEKVWIGLELIDQGDR